jgi:hypothetical protein
MVAIGFEEGIGAASSGSCFDFSAIVDEVHMAIRRDSIRKQARVGGNGFVERWRSCRRVRRCRNTNTDAIVSDIPMS